MGWSSKVATTMSKKPGPELFGQVVGEEQVVVCFIKLITNVTSIGQMDASVFCHRIYGSLSEQHTPSKTG